MSGVSSSYQPDRPRGGSGTASSLKARFENIAKADEEVKRTFFFETLFFCFEAFDGLYAGVILFFC